MDATTGMPSTIVLKSPNGRLDEGKAAGAITPGHLIEKDASGEWIVHGTAGGVHERTFAIEDAMRGATIATAYADNDFLRFWRFLPGDEVMAWLKAEESVVIDDNLISGGDGTLIKATGTIQQYVGKALQLLDLTGGSATRIKVQLF